MMRGGALVLAARLFFCLLLPVVSPAQTKLVRTRDAGFATVHYDNGLTLGAMTLYEGLQAQRKNSTTTADGVLSLFHDGRWSVQGFLQGAVVSEPVEVAPRYRSYFKSMRGEVSLGGSTSAQSGLMPSLQVTGRSRIYFDNDDRGAALGAAVARAFNSRLWQTTVMGEGSAWLRRSSRLYTVRTVPMQLATGDLLEDTEGSLDWIRGKNTYGLSLGMRLGESQHGTVGWGAFTVSMPLRDDLWASVSLGSYPADLLQSLPGGQYLSVTFRLPNGRIPAFRRHPPPPPAPPRPPELPMSERLSMVIGFALDSANLREIRVWAPGIKDVELLGDFVDWIPVPLIKQTNGEWRGYYRVTPGLHRLYLRLEGKEIDIPVNLTSVDDEFLGKVGMILVK